VLDTGLKNLFAGKSEIGSEFDTTKMTGILHGLNSIRYIPPIHGK